ncbi:sensor histidine kinase [Opitutus terrae]|uniref:histidine kinase n=1 Tax=Opitutus terrae (strain DSM 11246 / JCM 15787 / PB90-1) TaxID=452637 RepID=B1ZNQ3_OPITP|nr:two-component regulator propeller domain-containing protein [Opitutus terrae]ACB75423.1 PAS/PAC sensor signal transduction histidine kinase [Opitutus terrae PB90-1]
MRAAWLGLVAALLAAVTPAFALDPAKSIRQFNVQSWTRQTGLPADKIGDVVQTPDGFIWLGTQNGLVRFDGLEFKVVPITLPYAGGQDVAKLSIAPDGALWFAINRGGFGRFDGQKFSPIDDARFQDPRIAAGTILVGRDGAIWTGTVNGLNRWVKDRPAESFYAESVQPSGTVLALHEDAAGRMWVGTGGSGLYYHDGKSLHELRDESLRGYSTVALTSDARGAIWLATARSLRRLAPGAERTEVLLTEMPVSAVLVDRQGVVWFGTTSRGLGRYADGEFTFLGKAEGLASDNVFSLFEDREGSLWVGTPEGLSQLTDLKFPIFSKPEGLLEGSAIAVTPARAGGVWAAMASGVSYFDGRRAHNITDRELLPNPYQRTIFEARNGDLYVGDGDRNIHVFRDDRLLYRVHTELWPDAMTEDHESVLVGVGWMLYRLREGGLQPFEFQPGQDPNLGWINRLYVNADGTIWAGTNSGVARIRDGLVTRWSPAQGLSSDRVHFVFVDVDGAVWAGLPTGLARIKDERVANVRLADGLPDQRIFAIVPDEVGNFWISSGRGVFRAAREKLNAIADGQPVELGAELFGGLEAVKFTDRTDQGFSGCRSNDGRIWFPNPLGVMTIDPTKYFRNPIAPPVHLEQVRVNGEERPVTEKLVLQPGENRVEFTFTALSYIAPRKLRARYRLHGLEEEWVDAGPRRSALYSRLAPGNYTFQVQACNADGVWNTTGAELSFRLLPPFHETGWFYALCGLVSLAAVVGGHRWRVRHMEVARLKLQAERDLLETKVTERTAELAHEHALLTTLLDSSPDQIYFKDTESRYLKASQARAEALGLSSSGALIGRSDAELMPDSDVRAALAGEQEIIRTGQPLIGQVEVESEQAGNKRWLLTSKMPLRNKAGEIIGTFGISKDITMLKEAEAKLIEAHRQLLVTSRQAGMAEVATSVLHNVGNVLNSVNVSASLVSEKMRNARLDHLEKAVAMLQAHAGDLAEFLVSDPKGRKLPEFFALLSSQLTAERDEIARELEHLRKNVDHIKEVVAMQQSYAKVAGVAESMPLTDVVDDALRMYELELARHQITLDRDYQAQPVLRTDRHKLMQILVNLIQNAKYACKESNRPDRKIILRVTQADGRARVAVVDNGIGIPRESLSRIFAHGYTTRKDGHGFGLHSGALVAKELGGSLTAESGGAGEGATFTVELPLQASAGQESSPPPAASIS